MSDDGTLPFVDTNVLVYAHDSSAGEKHGRARELLQRLWSEGGGGLSTQVLQEFFVTITAKVPTPLETATARDRIEELGVWPVHRPTVGDVLEASRLSERHVISFWDALVIQSAAQLGCRTVWSEDLNDGQSYGSVRVLNPFTSTESPHSQADERETDE